VIAINDLLADAPETVNADPYNDGWFYRLQPEATAELDNLLGAEDYAEHCEED
jgi:glycine cleavage system H protein